MSRIKSLVTSAEVEVAKHAHNCRRNKRHRINCGEKRLSVRNGRSCSRYCLACAKVIVQRGIEKLHKLQEELLTP